jgi:hypothetical protein
MRTIRDDMPVLPNEIHLKNSKHLVFVISSWKSPVAVKTDTAQLSIFRVMQSELPEWYFFLFLPLSIIDD